MARQINKLETRTLDKVMEPGRHSDGGGLYLIVDESQAKRWMFMYRQGKRRREMGLGGGIAVSLKEARIMADEARRQLRQGIDPITERKRERAERKRALEPKRTFGDMALETINRLKTGFKNEKHIAQWEMTLRNYTKPLWPMDISAITTDDILPVLKPIWDRAPETASRLRGRIEKVLDAATALGLRSGENPARWKGNLDHLLPPRQKLTRGHHAAMPYAEVPAFLKRLNQSDAIANFALEFLILTATRSNEVREAKWEEVDMDSKVWTIPKARMKAGREHRVPLSDRALAILTQMKGIRSDDLIFPSARRGKPLSDMTMTAVLRRMEIVNATVHGFRSSFRDWAGEETAFPREVAEEALAHTVGDMTERAYRRGDALKRRSELMAAWEKFVGGSK